MNEFSQRFLSPLALSPEICNRKTKTGNAGRLLLLYCVSYCRCVHFVVRYYNVMFRRATIEIGRCVRVATRHRRCVWKTVIGFQLEPEDSLSSRYLIFDLIKIRLDEFSVLVSIRVL